MKNLSDVAIGLIATLLVMVTTYVTLFGFEYLDSYNTQKDRELFLKTYEIVVECRKDIAVLSADKICGQLPVFVNKVS
jgi:hypothetical protein